MSFIYVPPAAPTSSASFELVSTLTASNSATINLEGMDSTYQNYVIYGSNITSTSGTNYYLWCRCKINGTYQTSNYVYQWLYNDNTASQSSSNTFWANQSTFGGGTTKFYLNRLTATNCSFQMTIPNPSSTSQYKPITATGQQIGGSTQVWQSQLFGMCTTGTQALTGIQFYLDGSDTIATGTFTLYGIKNS